MQVPRDGVRDSGMMRLLHVKYMTPVMVHGGSKIEAHAAMRIPCGANVRRVQYNGEGASRSDGVQVVVVCAVDVLVGADASDSGRGA